MRAPIEYEIAIEDLDFGLELTAWCMPLSSGVESSLTDTLGEERSSSAMLGCQGVENLDAE